MTPAVLLCDLDDTLYAPDSGLMQLISTRVTDYVMTMLKIDEDEAQAIRRRYLSTYGATLRGLMVEHGGDPEDYLAYIHQLPTETVLMPDAELDRLLGELPMRRVIFTNSSAEHTNRVLKALGVWQHFEAIFDIRFMEFYAKPSPHSYRRALETLSVPASEVVFIEDSVRNLPPARSLGMRTVLVGVEESFADADCADHVASDIKAALRIVRAMD